MTGTPPRSIAPREATFAEQTRHHIAVRLLPFLFVLYLEHPPCREAFDHAQLLNSGILFFSLFTAKATL
jgi:hypothetical protein